MESIARGAAVYFILLIALRFSGRRTMAQMTPFDLVLVLMVAETTQQALLGNDYSIVNALILIVTLFAIDIALSYAKRCSKTVDAWLDGKPTLLVANGKLDLEALKNTRISRDDVLEAARQLHGLERLDQVKYAVLEADGDISIIPTDR
jgi:uncharacterized membrane protein YcaP (DUF421 family)